MMLPSLLLSVLMTLHVAPAVDGVAAPLLTFSHTDPITGNSLECDRCPPGTYLRAKCTATSKSECSPCPPGSFTELWNYIGRCLRCGVCGHNEVVKTECTADRDCQCQCKQGYYYSQKNHMCFRHSECTTGQEVVSRGTADADTVCHSCPDGTYSDTASANSCTPHKSCDAPGLALVLRGSIWHDSVCTSCQDLRSKDGGDYLKEIIPSFFVHQKLPIKRLRQIVHKLPSEDGKKQTSSGLNVSDLHALINTWVTSATAAQIRLLPAILTKTGANSAGERLQSKLQRIDSNINVLCPYLNNEVDMIVM